MVLRSRRDLRFINACSDDMVRQRVEHGTHKIQTPKLVVGFQKRVFRNLGVREITIKTIYCLCLVFSKPWMGIKGTTTVNFFHGSWGCV